MSIEYTIRPEQPSDYTGIFKVNQEAFGRDEEAKLVEYIRRGNFFIKSLSLVALHQNAVIGHVLFSVISILDEKGNRHVSLALAPVAVLPEFQKQGVGAALIRVGISEARDAGYQSIIVLGHQQYYPRLDFCPPIVGE